MASVHATGKSGSGYGDHEDNQSDANELSTKAFKYNFKVYLLKATKDVKTAGKFALDEKMEIPPDFSISGDGVGYIPLPLKKSHARQIITKARQA
ncbi:hypothetical protein F53441_2423 [Fusarium austroafricanum]|uniref:Uncharacterized protein n=1 Tax=Fusarium austroafricanum TaxID=2364996 RepID=A0A8H4KT96_9HYPO|nr:hypothetical protein F53441_2423 [Fusarium austroafricanum]